MRQNKAYDAEIIIIGGGLAGLTLSCALGSKNISVICLEREIIQKQLRAEYDERTTAIAGGPKKLLEECGVWPALKDSAGPINHIRVADQNNPPALDFYAHDIGSEPFGYIVENSKLREALLKRAGQLKKFVHILAPAQMAKICFSAEQPATVKLTNGQVLKCNLVVGADGRQSPTREWAGIESYGWQYDQAALVCTIKHSQDHHQTAVENFCANGPLATLPMSGQRSSVVWSVKRETANWLMERPMPEFTAILQEQVGSWLGKIELCGKPACYPLNMRHAKTYTGTRLALINEAAHGIHPIAGQGLNLGMRDITALVSILQEAFLLGQDPGSPECLKQYEKARRFDTGTMVLGMDMLVRGFSNANPLCEYARRFGLGIVQNTPALKKFFMRQAVG